MMKICLLDAVTLGKDVDTAGFARIGEFTEYHTTTPEQVVERIKDQEIVITNKVILNESNLSHAKNLKLICLTATGTNNVDLEYTKSRGIAVANVAGYSTNSVAQHTFAMLFYILEHMPYYDNYVKSREYIKSEMFCHLDKSFWELNGKTWGIIGLGNIGKAVARIAAAFGCKVIYYSTTGRNNDRVYESVGLEELLRTSDVVSIHSALNAETQGIIDYPKIALMKKHAILLNLGRGGIMNEKGLAKALKENLIWGAGLDVIEFEPMRDASPLHDVAGSRLLVTPHIAWASIESRARLVSEVEENIKAFLVGELRNRVC